MFFARLKSSSKVLHSFLIHCDSIQNGLFKSNVVWCQSVAKASVQPRRCIHVKTSGKMLIKYCNKALAANVLTKSKQDSINSLIEEILSRGERNDVSDAVRAEVMKMLDILFSHNVTREDIKAHINQLCNDLTVSKVSILTEITERVSDLLPLLTLPEATLKRIAKQMTVNANKDKVDFSSRVFFLCKHLELSIPDLVDLVKKHNCLISMNFQKLQTKMEILKSGPMDVNNLVKDPWIFNYNEKLLLERVTIANNAQMTLKPWLLRCSKKYFHEYVSKWKMTQQVLGGIDPVSYLAKKLNCSNSYIQSLMERNTLLHTTNVIKLDNVLEFLFKKGYTSEEICLFPKVFCSSIETLSKRFDEFLEIKGAAPTLPQLCISQIYKQALKKPQTSRDVSADSKDLPTLTVIEKDHCISPLLN